MFLLVVLFIVVPIAELYVIIQVGEAIGVLPTLLLLLADAVLGSLLLRHQGRGAWRRFNEALAQRRFPGKEVADGVLIVIGGTLLLTPGFLTDIVGVFLLIPPTRAIVAGAAEALHARPLHGGRGLRSRGLRPPPVRRAGRRAPAPSATTTSTPPPRRCRPTATAADISCRGSTTIETSHRPYGPTCDERYRGEGASASSRTDSSRPRTRTWAPEPTPRVQ